jgi:hypothetical protein
MDRACGAGQGDPLMNQARYELEMNGYSTRNLRDGCKRFYMLSATRPADRLGTYFKKSLPGNAGQEEILQGWKDLRDAVRLQEEVWLTE